MKSWQYEEGDVLRITRKGNEFLARVAGFADQLDNTTPLYVNLRVSGGLRWSSAKVKVHPNQIIEHLPNWYKEQEAKWEAELKEFAEKQWAKMTDAEKKRTHEFAVRHGYRVERRSPIEIMIDQATGYDGK